MDIKEQYEKMVIVARLDELARQIEILKAEIAVLTEGSQ